MKLQPAITSHTEESNLYLVLQVFLRYLDGVVLDSVSVPLVGDLLGHQLLKDEEQQLVVVSAEGQVTSECLHRETETNPLVVDVPPTHSGVYCRLTRGFDTVSEKFSGGHKPSSCSS